MEIASAVPMYMLKRPVSGNTEEQIWQLAKTCVKKEDVIYIEIRGIGCRGSFIYLLLYQLHFVP